MSVAIKGRKVEGPMRNDTKTYAAARTLRASRWDSCFPSHLQGRNAQAVILTRQQTETHHVGVRWALTSIWLGLAKPCKMLVHFSSFLSNQEITSPSPKRDDQAILLSKKCLLAN